MRTSPKLLPLLLISTALLAAGCSKTDEKEGAAADSAAEAQADNQMVADVDEAPKAATVDYWKPLAPYVAGNYETSCSKVSSPAEEQPVTITVGTDGLYKAGEYGGNIAKSGMVILFHRFAADGSVIASISAPGEDSTFTAGTKEDGKGRLISVGTDGANMLMCDDSAAMPLVAKPLHVVFGSVLNKSFKTECVNPGLLGTSPIEISIKDGMLAFGSNTYPLAKMTEKVQVTDGFSALSYTASRGEDESVDLIFDGDGKLTAAIEVNKAKGGRMCSTDK